MTNCPPRLRGDLSKWLCEINAGVYVGHISSRVRDALWERVCANLKNGSATLVYTTNGEQKMDFRIHNSTWTPVDFDGIKLMRRPLPQAIQPADSLKPGFSKAAKQQFLGRGGSGRTKQQECYIVLDLETTGLDPARDSILEFGALKIEDGVPTASFSRLVKYAGKIPELIVKLTGITEEQIAEQGAELETALDAFLRFIGQEKLVGYNIAFDMEFLRAACEKYARPWITNPCMDLLPLARRKVYGITNYKLQTLATHFGLEQKESHRALADCELIYALRNKLKENHGR